MNTSLPIKVLPLSKLSDALGSLTGDVWRVFLRPLTGVSATRRNRRQVLSCRQQSQQMDIFYLSALLARASSVRGAAKPIVLAVLSSMTTRILSARTTGVTKADDDLSCLRSLLSHRPSKAPLKIVCFCQTLCRQPH
jgi:hypothetical protein